MHSAAAVATEPEVPTDVGSAGRDDPSSRTELWFSTPSSPRSTNARTSGWCASYNPNVANTMGYTFVDGACYSLWGMQLLPLFLKEITSHTSSIGLAATLSGVAQLIGALGVGYFADHNSRAPCIRIGVICGVASLLTLLCAISLSSSKLVFAGQTLWGLCTGVTSTSVEALFADSVPQGRRTRIYNAKWMLQTLCYVFGYASAAGLFSLWHNKWELRKMRVALMMGVSVHPIAFVPLCWLKDQYAVHVAGETTAAAEVEEERPRCSRDRGGGREEATTTGAASAARAEAASRLGWPPLTTSTVGEAQAPANNARVERGSRLAAASLESSHCGTTSDEQQQQQQLLAEERSAVKPGLLCLPHRCPTRSCACAGRLTSRSRVPHWICAVDLCLAIGSGMSLPYFPLFFATDRGVSPAGLYGIFITTTLLTAAASSLLPWIATSCGAGRIPTVMGIRICGTVALLFLATAPRGTALGSLPVTITLFLCRNALMNSVFGVTRSVIMDCATRGTRAKWSAFESVTSLSWAGSAAVGGCITERYGYSTNFIITAVVQLLATLLMIPAAIGARELDATHPPTVAAAVETEEEEENRRA
jgi:MFS family permease